MVRFRPRSWDPRDTEARFTGELKACRVIGNTRPDETDYTCSQQGSDFRSTIFARIVGDGRRGSWHRHPSNLSHGRRHSVAASVLRSHMPCKRKLSAHNLRVVSFESSPSRETPQLRFRYCGVFEVMLNASLVDRTFSAIVFVRI